MSFERREKKRQLEERRVQARTRLRFKTALDDLRYTVENINKIADISLRNGTFKDLNIKQIFTTNVDGWEFGYQLKDLGIHMLRNIYIKSEQPLEELTKEERDPIIKGVLDVFIDRAVGDVGIEPLGPNSLKISQTFLPSYWVEKNPNLIVPGGPS